MINLICDRALMAGRQAEASKITEEHVRRAAGALGFAIPRTRVRRELAPLSGLVRRRAAVTAGLLLIVAGAAAAGAVVVFGDPRDLVSGPTLPRAAAAPRPAIPTGLAPVSMPTAQDLAAPPPLEAGPFSVLVGTFDDYRRVARVCGELSARGLPYYTVDLTFGAGDVRRRVLVGRFPTHEAAEGARSKIEDLAAEARVIPGELERLRTVPP
jgi:hypothetical protein